MIRVHDIIDILSSYNRITIDDFLSEFQEVLRDIALLIITIIVNSVVVIIESFLKVIAFAFTTFTCETSTLTCYMLVVFAVI